MTPSHRPSRGSPPTSPATDERELRRTYRILHLTTEPADAAAVEESLAEHLPEVLITWQSGLPTDPLGAGRRPDCILVDLEIGTCPIDSVETVLGLADNVPVIALTSLSDRSLGAAAVARGASDYLVKGAHDGEELSRAIIYAVETASAGAARSQLREAELLRAENLRLERGLLPRPLLTDEKVLLRRHYRPGSQAGVLGGDFFDLVEQSDGTIRMMIGDVSGHGPDEAALGVCLRIAWRTLVLQGAPQNEVFYAMHDVLLAERQDRQFCTACDVTITADRRRLSWRLAGHPPPILLGPEPLLLDGSRRGLPLGVRGPKSWPAAELDLAPPWGVLLFTDGVFEATLAAGDRLGIAGLVDLVRDHPTPTDLGSLNALLGAVGLPHARSGHNDDLAVMALMLPGR